MLELCAKAPTMRTMWNQIQMHWRCCWSMDGPWIKALASVLAPCPSNGVDLPGSLDPQDVEVKKRPKESLSWISFHRDRGNHAAQDTERMVRLVGQFRPNFLPSKLLRGASDSAIFFFVICSPLHVSCQCILCCRKKIVSLSFVRISKVFAPMLLSHSLRDLCLLRLTDADLERRVPAAAYEANCYALSIFLVTSCAF